MLKHHATQNLKGNSLRASAFLICAEMTSIILMDLLLNLTFALLLRSFWYTFFDLHLLFKYSMIEVSTLDSCLMFCIPPISVWCSFFPIFENGFLILLKLSVWGWWDNSTARCTSYSYIDLHSIANTHMLSNGCL